MDKAFVQGVFSQLEGYTHHLNWTSIPFLGNTVMNILNDLLVIANDINNENLYLSSRISTLRNGLFLLNGAPTSVIYPNCFYTIEPLHMGSLLEILNMLLYQDSIPANVLRTDSRVFKKIFISHQKNDYNQILALIDLLYAIGIPRPSSNRENFIFCSSYPVSYLPNDSQNLDELKKHLNDSANTFYILWYTDNFFNSYACLNEAGAIWVNSGKYQEILSPTFDEAKIGGLLGKKPILFRANDKYRLNMFKDDIERKFALPQVPLNTWEIARDDFINKINKIAIKIE